MPVPLEKGYSILLFILTVGVLQCLGSRIVVTNVGSFQGNAATDGEYFEFLGIPYGQVNQRNPFGVAAPYTSFSGIYVANNDSIICPQVDRNGNSVGSLDCLRLNVYIPKIANVTSQLPVMVYIHGGFFMRGHAGKNENGPRFLIRHDVIIVTINYRVGPYGFMCLNRRAVPGNQGLKDQVLALKWVKDNIAAFGGNPDQVTLFGLSAGAHSIDLHLLSEHGRYYHKVIMQSGSSLATTVLYEPDRYAHIKLASYLGLEHGSASEALNSLSNADPEDVVKAAAQLNIEFKPCAETKFEGVEPFITNYWINSPVPKAQGIPIIIGFTEYENMMRHITAGSDHFQGLANLFYNNLNHTFDFDDDRVKRMEDYSKRFYLGDDDINQDSVWQVINFESDYWYIHPLQRSIKKFVESPAANIFYYMFSYSGGLNAGSTADLNVQGASHSDDLRYLFTSSSTPAQISAQDQIIIDRMTAMWTNFAKYSNPTPDTTTLLPVQWTPLTGDAYHYLKIDTNFTMERRPLNRRMAFWDLFYKLNNDYQRSHDAVVAAEDDDHDDVNSSKINSGNAVNLLITLLIVVAFTE